MHPQLPQPSCPFHGSPANPSHRQSFGPHIVCFFISIFSIASPVKQAEGSLEIKQDHIILFKYIQGVPIAFGWEYVTLLFMLFLVMKSLLDIFLGLLHNWSCDIVAFTNDLYSPLLAAGWLGVCGGSQLGSLTPPQNTGSCTKPYNWVGWLCFVNTILLVPQLS